MSEEARFGTPIEYDQAVEPEPELPAPVPGNVIDEVNRPKTLLWVNRGTKALTRPLRTVKMARAKCSICKPSGGQWWKTCRHDPYHSEAIVDEVQLITDPQPDGSEVVLDRKLIQRRMTTLNVIEVAYEKKVNSGLGPAAAIARGAKHLHELNYRPVCEFNGCYEPDPQVKTRYGNYCCEYEAKLIAARFRGIPLSITDNDIKARQLEAINL